MRSHSPRREAERSLIELLDDQIGYVEREARRMHRLEQRLHRLGGTLFAITALACAGVVGTRRSARFWPMVQATKSITCR